MSKGSSLNFLCGILIWKGNFSFLGRRNPISIGHSGSWNRGGLARSMWTPDGPLCSAHASPRSTPRGWATSPRPKNSGGGTKWTKFDTRTRWDSNSCSQHFIGIPFVLGAVRCFSVLGRLGNAKNSIWRPKFFIGVDLVCVDDFWWTYAALCRPRLVSRKRKNCFTPKIPIFFWFLYVQWYLYYWRWFFFEVANVYFVHRSIKLFFNFGRFYVFLDLARK